MESTGLSTPKNTSQKYVKTDVLVKLCNLNESFLNRLVSTR